MMQRTIIYVDGFNLYYGCLKKTPYRWLDLKSLFEKLLDSSHQICKIKYFTALVSTRTNDEQSRLHQRYYLSAIETFISEIEIHYGHYLTHEVKAKVANPPPEFINILKTEEKGSDVNLAAHLLNDAWLNNYDCAVLVSNDSDLAEPMKLVKMHHKKNLGLIFPNINSKRKPSRQLCTHADFIKPIRHTVLANSQLPSKIPNSIITKPLNW
ncbi:MAG TPA: NYN domain-containing protein [Coxiellaceae bacterium]|nr:MAG: NYN domain-containing protein [Gammaproteobacteria bacterium RIFCSPHIGHO2_12_FULL_36_30]HLB56573.1 NYN domain-containing protein [Coxiellaceae bacterium]